MALQNNQYVKLPLETPTSRRVTFPNTPNLDLVLLTASLTQKANTHDVLVLNFQGKINDPANSLVSDDPVIFTWDGGGAIKTFVGFISYVSPTTLADNATQVVCLSPSYLLKNGAQKIYKNVTADAVVTKLAKKNGLNPITDRHPKIFPSVVQAGQSDWQVARSMAKQTGFILVNDGTTLYFVSKNRLATASRGSAPYFYASTQDERSRVASKLGTIYTFDPIISDGSPDMPGATVDRAVSGIHAITDVPIDVIHPTVPTQDHGYGIISPNAEYFA
jgi:hypothetical protein